MEEILPLRVVIPDSHDWKTLGTGGGIESFLKMLFAHAKEERLRLTLVCAGPPGSDDGLTSIISIMDRAKSEIEFLKRLTRFAKAHDFAGDTPTVVLANAEHYAWAFRKTGLPIVLFSHGAIPEALKLRHSPMFVRIFRLIAERYAVLHSRQIVLANETLTDYYRSRYPRLDPGRLTQIPIGLDLAEYENRPRDDPFKLHSLSRTDDIVLFVGRLYPEKNVRLFLSACDLLARRSPNLRAVIVGNGPDGTLVSERRKSESWITWMPSLSHDSVLDLMSIAKALVVSSTYEAGPLVMLEAIASGLPVVSTDVGRSRELLSGELGVVLPPNASAFAGALERVIAWPRDAVRAASREQISKIDFATTLHALAAVLREAAASQGG